MADDIIFSLSGDGSSAVSEVQGLIEAFGKLDEAINSLGNSLSVLKDVADAFDNVYSATKLATSGVETFGLQFDESMGLVKSSLTTFDSFITSASNLGASLDPAMTAISALDDAVMGLSDSAFIALDDLKALGASGVQATAGLDPLATANQAAASSAQQLQASATAAATALDAQAVAAQNADASLVQGAADEDLDAQAVDNMTASLDAADASASGMVGVSQDLEQALGNLLNAIEKVTLDLKDMSGQLSSSATNAKEAALAFDSTGQAMAAQNAAMASTRVATADASMGMAEMGAATRTAGEEASYASGLFGPDSMNLILMATAIGMAGGAFLQMGMQAQTAISHITGLADQSLALSKNSQQLQGYIDALGQSAMKYGVSLADAANGLYYIISAGFKTSDALTVLDSSMKAASATGTSMDVVSNALTSILNAYGLSAANAASVTDKMVQTVVSGKQEFTTFANAIGPVASAASHAGISMEQMFAAEASLSQINPRIRQDAQNLANLFNTLSNNAQKIVDAADAMGGHLTLASFQSMPLIDKLQTLAKIAGGDTTTAFRTLLQNQTAATAAFNLLRDGGSSYNDILGQIKNSQGALDTAFQQTSEDLDFGMKQISAAISYISYQFVTMIGPVIKPILDQIVIAVQFVAAHFQQLEPIVAGLATFLGVVLVGAVVALTGFMLSLGGPIVAIATAAGLVTTAFTFLVPQFQNLWSWLNTTFPMLSTFTDLLRTLANIIGGALLMAWNNLINALPNIEMWFNQHVTPAVITVINNLINFGVVLLSRIIPAVEAFINNTLKPLAANIMTNVVPAIGKLIDNVMKFAEYVSGHIPQILQKLSDDLKILAIAATIVGIIFAGMNAGAFVAFSGGILRVIVTALVPLIVLLTTTIPDALMSLAFAFAWIATPVGLIVAAILAVGAAIAWVTIESQKMQQLWGTLTGPLTDVWNSIKQAVSDVAQSFQQNLLPALQDLWKIIQPLLPALKVLAEILGVVLISALGIVIEVLASAITIIGKGFAGLIQALGGAIKFIQDIIKLLYDLGQALTGSGGKADAQRKLWAQVWEDIKNVVKDGWQVIVGLYNASIGAIIAGVVQFVQNIIKFFQNMSDVLVGHSIVPDMLNKIVQLFQQFPQKVLQVIQGWVTSVIQWFQKLADQLVGHSIVPDMLNKIVQLFQQFPQKVLQVIQQFVQSAIQFFTDFGQKAVQAMQSAMTAIGQSVSQGFQALMQVVNQGIQTISQPFKDLASSKTMQWGSDFIKQFTSGVLSQMQNLMMAVWGMASNIAGYLHFSKPDVGPLSDADQWGPDFGNLLASGINAQANKVGNAAKNIALSIGGAAPSTASFSTSIIATNDPVVAVLKDILSVMKNSNGTQQGVIGGPAASSSMGSVNQQFVLNAMTNANMNYSQMNTLMGLAYEYANRGSRTGLGI